MTLRALLRLDRHPLHNEHATAEQLALLDPKNPGHSLRQVADWLQSVGEETSSRRRGAWR